MPVNIKIIHPTDFIRTTVSGDIDLTASRQLILDLASMIPTPGEYHVLIDCRHAHAKLTPGELFFIGDAVASYPTLAKSRTAILNSMDEEDNGKFVELVARNRGAQLMAFTSFEEAINRLVFADGSTAAN